jgi:hypothetical protein
VATARGASVAAALDALLPQLVARLDQGLPDRGPDPALLEQMKKRGTSSLEAYRLVTASFEGFYGAYYADSERWSKLAAEAVKKDPGWARAYANLALLQGQRGKAAKGTLASAKTQVDRARDADGLALLEGLDRLANGQTREAFELLAPINRQDPADVLVVYALDTSASIAGDLEASISFARRLLELRPDLQFGADLAQFLSNANRRGEIAPMLSAWVKRAPESEQAHLSLASALASERLQDAEVEVRRALLLYGEATFRLAPVCDVLLAAEKLAEVKRLASRMMEGNEFDRARGYLRLAEAALLEGRFGVAYEQLQAAQELARHQGTEGESPQILQLIAALAPLVATPEDRARHLESLAGHLSLQGDAVAAAAARYELSLARRSPGVCPDGEALIAGLPEGTQRTSARRAVLRLAAEGGCAPCSAVLRSGLSNEEIDARSLFRFAVCAEREGQLRLAESTLRTVRRLDGSWPYFHSVLARFHLGRVLGRLGRPDAARAELQDFLNHWGQSDVPLPQVDEARRLLSAP